MVKNLIHNDLPGAPGHRGAVLRNRIFIDRTQGIGVIRRKTRSRGASTGPMARASGVRRDLRKDEPYLCYADNWDGQGAEAVKFKVPVCERATCYARFLVRWRRSSSRCKIIEQLIDNIPGGPMDTFADSKMDQAEQARRVRLDRGADPALRDHHEQPRVEAADRRGLRRQRDRQRRAGVLHRERRRAAGVARQGRPPSFINYSMMQKLTEGHMLADVVAIIGSLNIVAAELDR
jgi:NADH-quinone oxidoreductase subunit D